MYNCLEVKKKRLNLEEYLAYVKESGILSSKSIVIRMSILSRVPEFMTRLLHFKPYKSHSDRQGASVWPPLVKKVNNFKNVEAMTEKT